MTLTPKERVTYTIKRQEVDRLPVDFWAVPEVFENLKRALRVSSDEEILQSLDVDCRVIAPPYRGPVKREEKGIFYDLFGVPRRRVKNPYSTYEEYASHPLAHFTSLSEIHQHNWPEPSYWDFAALPDMIAQINAQTQYSLRYDVGGIFETAWSLRGLEQFLLDLVIEPEIPYGIMERVTDYFIQMAREVLERVGDEVDIVYTYDDVGTQQGLFLSPDHYRELIRPHHVRLNKVLREYPVFILYHSCGAILPLIEDFIKLPIDILNPLQPTAAGMDLRVIKERFGDQVAFHGGIDIQHLLRETDRDRMKEEIERIISILGSQGGYIMAPTHYLQADIPLDNILTLYQQIERRVGAYP